MLKYNIAQRNGELTSVTAFIDDAQWCATPDHPNFDTICKTLREHFTTLTRLDVDKLFDISIAIGAEFTHLSERITVNNGRIFMDGVEVRNVLTETIVRYMKDLKGDFVPLVMFMEKLETNPNEHSREQLFGWLESHNFGIADDGDFIAYKGITNSNESSSSGKATVNGKMYDGRIPNQRDTIVEMPRDKVAHDPSVACHAGLHVANWNYASSFCDKTVQVKVNPRDVVSVPTDTSGEKMRVCRYRVLGEVTAEQKNYLYTAGSRVAVAREQRGSVTVPKLSGKRAKRAGAAIKRADTWPEYYEQFKLADFGRLAVGELRWLAKEWGVGIKRTRSDFNKAMHKEAKQRLKTWK